ncbi:MAG: hypothetical protein R3B48_17775 [Kofleriaceae bacterium]
MKHLASAVTFASTSPIQASTSPESRAGLSLPAAALVLLAFTAFSLWVCAVDGPLGFLSLVRREPWGLQLLLDLAIAAYLTLTWMVRDARQRGIRAWPYVLATTFIGSIGLLSYLVHRGLAARARSTSGG